MAVSTGNDGDAKVSASVPTLHERLAALRKLPLDEAEGLLKILDVSESVDLGQTSNARIPWTFIAECSRHDKLICLRACILCYSVTDGKQIPRVLQLKSVLAIVHDKDCLVNTGTGSGKTLPIALNILLQDRAHEGRVVSLTISPLKRLQTSQENDFNTKYCCPTVTINDETPKEQKWYDQNIYNASSNTPGRALHLIVTAEQLCKTPEGHDPPLLRLLVKSLPFRKRIRNVNVDEVHVIHTSGISRYQQPAFRPAWGRLLELRALLSSSVPFRCLSATITTSILKTIETRVLRPTYITIRSTSNRSNTIYATHQVPTTIDDPKNYDCFIRRPISSIQQPRVLIFFDNTALADQVAEYLLSQFPDTPEYQSPPIVRHYHSLMSTRYLEQTHADFTDERKTCKILCATSGESIGVDFPDVEYVCNAGVPRDLTDAIQRAGRVGRREGTKGLFVIFHEPWVRSLSLNAYQGDCNDLDRPQMIPERHKFAKTYLTVRQRASYASVKYIQSNGCLRREFADYLGEDLHDEASLAHSTEYCCDRHPNKNGISFNLTAALPSPLYIPANNPPASSARKSRPKHRPVSDRNLLSARLEEWVEENKGDIARHHVLHKINRAKLCKQLPGVVRTPADVVQALQETNEWGKDWGFGIAKVVFEHDWPSDRRRVRLGNSNITLSF